MSSRIHPFWSFAVGYNIFCYLDVLKGVWAGDSQEHGDCRIHPNGPGAKDRHAPRTRRASTP